MSTWDVFKASAFSMRALTAAINNMPYVPRRLDELGIFMPRTIDTTVCQIELRDGALYLVPAKPRNADPTHSKANVRKVVPMNLLHLPVDDQITADEIQDIRRFGDEKMLERVQDKVNEKLATMLNSINATLEHHRVGAIKGIVTDADGATVLYNLFTEFGLTQLSTREFNFLESNPASGKIRKLCSQIIRDTEDELGEATHMGIHAFCGSRFMDDLTSLDETIEAYQRYSTQQGLVAGMGGQLRQQVARRTFHYAGIDFEEYRGKVGNVSYFDQDEVRFFPKGVPDLFHGVFGPSNYLSDVNQTGQPIYAKVTVDPKDRFADIDVQSNPLHYCTRPRTLLQGVGRSG